MSASKKINPSDYSPPNVNYWGDRCCKAEAEIERLRTALEYVVNYSNDPWVVANVRDALKSNKRS